MTEPERFRLYEGTGNVGRDGNVALDELLPPAALDDPARYLAEPALRDAVNVALALGQPLLVTGEPGTGKTQLAGSIAHELALPPPLVFNTKSTSSARDLFYRYDALRHFHDSQFRQGQTVVEDYIEYEALGRAILAARENPPRRAVVLIDEIDKAPRDLPNDVLNEIEEMAFTVKETGKTYAADRRFKPIVVLTSNSEKTLPDAFLRRCVFYHLTFPDRAHLAAIVQRRVGTSAWFSPERLDQALAQFERIRELGLRKKPSTAELIAWIRILDRLKFDPQSPEPGTREALGFTYSILAKSREDLALLRERLGQGSLG